MARVLIIGAGGVGSVVAHKCAQNPEVFTEIMLASRTVSKCDAIAASIKERTGRIIETARVNADDVPELVALIKRYKPVMVINVALPYQDLTIMDACLEACIYCFLCSKRSLCTIGYQTCARFLYYLADWFYDGSFGGLYFHEPARRRTSATIMTSRKC